MSSSHRFIGTAVLAAAAGAAACSSSSHPATTTDAAASDAAEAAAPCTASDAGLLAAYAPPSGVNDAGFNPGNAWACEKAMCAAQVTACSNDCACNAATLGGLACAAGIGTYPAEVDCFDTAFAAILQGTADSPLDKMGTCIIDNLESCSGIAPEAGADGETGEASASDAGASDTGASDTGVATDAGAIDAADGGVEQ